MNQRLRWQIRPSCRHRAPLSRASCFSPLPHPSTATFAKRRKISHSRKWRAAADKRPFSKRTLPAARRRSKGVREQRRVPARVAFVEEVFELPRASQCPRAWHRVHAARSRRPRKKLYRRGVARWRHPCEAPSPHGKRHDGRGDAFDHVARHRLPRHGGNGTSRRRDPPRREAQQHLARFNGMRAPHRLRHCANLARPGSARLGNARLLVARKLLSFKR